MSAQKKTTSENTNTKQDFTADVSRLLDIVANALYTNKDVFLRELISNAADACDKLRYQAIQKPDLITDNQNFRIHIYKDTDKRTLTIVDNGVGMSEKELKDNLGTIAKSGTAALMDKMKKSKTEGTDPLKLIGQFGVGFYASYMVADRVAVTSRKAGQKKISTWESDGRTGFEIRKPTTEETAALDGDRGTAITLYMKDDEADFMFDPKIKETIEQYSDHIDVKIFFNTPEDTEKGEGQPVNKASALWQRPKNEITTEQYTEFYRSLTHGFDEPILTCHWRAEGTIEFTGLLYVPTMRPMDLYDPGRQSSVRLYVRRVLISSHMDGLMFPWLRMVRGVIDSSDLPLNISRETLQHNPIITKIRSAAARKILSELDKLSREDEVGFIAFWGQFGAAIKEGLYDADQHREDIFKICRFYSTHENGEKLITLNDYVERMQDDQKEIYYITGENLDNLKNSPQLEGFKAAGIEVLFFTDTIDDFWLQQVPDYKEKTFKSITKGNIDLPQNEEKKAETEKETEAHKNFIATLKDILKDDVDDVRISNRLTDSPVCIVASDTGMDMNMERVLKVHQKYEGASKPVLEINIKHTLIQKLETISTDNKDRFEDAAHLLFDQAKIIQGEPVKNPTEFARRMSTFMQDSL